MQLFGNNVACLLVIGFFLMLAFPRFVLLAPTRRLPFFALVEQGTLIWVACLAWVVHCQRLRMSVPH